MLAIAIVLKTAQTPIRDSKNTTALLALRSKYYTGTESATWFLSASAQRSIEIIVIMELYCLFLIAGLVRLARPENSSAHITPLMLNGHYVKWPASKLQDIFINDKRYVPKNIIYTRFQLCTDRIFLAAPRYK